MVGGDDALAQLLEARRRRACRGIRAGRAGRSGAARGRRPGSWRACAILRAPRPAGSGPRRRSAGCACPARRSASSCCSTASSSRALATAPVSRPRPWATSRSRSSPSTWVETRLIALRRGAVDIGQQMRDQGRLAGADLAGDDDEALALGEAVAQIGHRLLVGAAVEPEARVGRQLERLSGQAVSLGVHVSLPLAAPVRRCI